MTAERDRLAALIEDIYMGGLDGPEAADRLIAAGFGDKRDLAARYADLVTAARLWHQLHHPPDQPTCCDLGMALDAIREVSDDRRA